MKMRRLGAILLCAVMVLTSSNVLQCFKGISDENVVLAAELPEPVVKYDFEAVNGTSVSNIGTNTGIGAAQIVGSGTIVADSERGNVFYNHGVNEFDKTVRENYLKLDSNIFKDAITGNGFTLTMWMKFDATKIDISQDHNYRWADIFVAYDSDYWEKYPMVKLGVNLIGRVNNTQSDRKYFFDTVDMGNYLADSKWHQIGFTISTSNTGIYVDGKEVSSIALTGGRGATVGDLFSSTKNLIDTITIGGNSLWMEDPDMIAMFDDICIYNTALTKEQLNQASGYIEGGVSFNDVAITSGKAISYTINSALINTNNIKSYEWYVGGKQVSTSSAAYTPTANDIENTITLKITLKDGSYTDCSSYYSMFPVLYIDSDTSYGSVGEQYVGVNFNLTGSGYTAEQLYNGNAEIKIRGNSTAGLAKRPFKVKLESKTDILGFGKSKHWVLLANGIDVSLLRNKLLQGLAGDLGLDYMESELITLVYNGEYQGVYELSEHVRIGSTRVDIFDWEDLAEDGAKAIAKSLRDSGAITETQYDTVKDELEDELSENFSWVTSKSFKSSYLKNLGKTSTFTMSNYIDYSTVPEVTGGALLEMDFWYEIQEGKQPNLKTAYAMPIYTNTPDSTETKFDTLVSYLDKYVQAMEYSLHSTDFVFKNSDQHYAVADQGWYDGSKRVGVTYNKVNFTSNEYNGWHYTDFLDIESAINNMLICEVSLNWDCMKNSFFMYKDIEGKMIFGPVWDFDWAWGNSMGQDTNAPETWQTTNEWFANEQYYQTVQWNRLLIRDPYFVVKLYERYHEVRDAYIAPLVNTSVQQMSLANMKAGLANDARWGTAFSATAGQNYSDQVSYIQTFLNRRLTWLDKQFASIDTLMKSLGYYVTSNDIKAGTVDTEGTKGYTLVTANVSGSKIKKVSFQVNGKNFYTADVSNGSATVKIPDSVLVAEGSLNVVQFRGMDANGSYVVNTNGTITGNYTNAVSNYTTFAKTVSNDVVVDTTPGVNLDGSELGDNGTIGGGVSQETTGSEDESSSEKETNKNDKDDNNGKNDKNDATVNKPTEGKDVNLNGSTDSSGVNSAVNSSGMSVWMLVGILILIFGAGAAAVIVILKKNGIIGNKTSAETNNIEEANSSEE